MSTRTINVKNAKRSVLRVLGGLLFSLAATLSAEHQALAAAAPPAPTAPTAPAPPTAAPTTAPANLTKEDYATLFRAADESLTSMGRRCATNTGEVDLEAEAVYIRSAHVFAWVVKDYPYDDESERSTHTGWAVQAYERAFQCNPTLDNREYLEDALNLLEFRLTLAVSQEKRPIDSADLEPLRQTGRRLRERLKGLVPTSAPEARCPQEEQAPAEDKRSDEDARTLAILDAFSLEIEVGTGGRWALQSERVIFAGSISSSARFVLGKERQHRLQLGFQYSTQYHNIREPAAQTLVAQVDYGIADASGWLAAHASIGAGLQMLGTMSDVSRAVVAPGLGICTLDEALCLRVRGFFGPQKINFITVGVGLDPIRLAARQIRKRGKKSKKGAKP